MSFLVNITSAILRSVGKVAAFGLTESVDVGMPWPFQAEKPLSSPLTERPGSAVVKGINARSMRGQCAVNARSMLAQCAAWPPHNCFSRASRPQFNR